MWHVLKGKVVVEATEEEWKEWILRHVHDLHIANDLIRGIRISTVFVGIPLSAQLGKPTTFFQSKVTGGKLDGRIEHFATYKDAIEGHKKICADVIETL